MQQLINAIKGFKDAIDTAFLEYPNDNKQWSDDILIIHCDDKEELRQLFNKAKEEWSTFETGMNSIEEGQFPRYIMAKIFSNIDPNEEDVVKYKRMCLSRAERTLNALGLYYTIDVTTDFEELCLCVFVHLKGKECHNRKNVVQWTCCEN